MCSPIRTSLFFFLFYSGVLWSFSAVIQSTFSLGAPWSPIHAPHRRRWRSGRSGLDAPLLTDEACKASGMTLSTGKSAALAPLLKHSSHHLSCWALQRATIVPPSTPIRSCRFRREVARRHLQSSSVSPGLYTLRTKDGGGGGKGGSVGEEQLSAVRREVIIRPCLCRHRAHWCAAALAFGKQYCGQSGL